MIYSTSNCFKYCICLLLFCFSIPANADESSEMNFKTYTALADEYYEKGDYPTAQQYYSKALECVRNIAKPNSVELITGLGNLGSVFHTQGMIGKALVYYSEAVDVCRKVNDTVELSINLANKSQCLFLLGYYNDALIQMREALEIEKKLGNEEGQSINLNAIGKIYEKWGRLPEAIDFYNQALEIDRRHNKPSRIAIRLSGIGSAYTSLGEFTKALQFQNEALDIELKLGNKEKIALRQERLGKTYQQMGSYNTAQDFFLKALKAFKELSLDNAVANTMLLLARNYGFKGNLNEAVRYYQECLLKAQGLDLRPIMLSAHQELAEILYRQGNHRTAFEHMKASIAIEDSLFNAESLRQINEFREVYESEKKEKENQLLLKDIELKKKNQRLALVSVAGLLIITFILFILYRVKSITLKQNKLLQKNEQDLMIAQITKKEIEAKRLEDQIFAEQQINRLQAEKYAIGLEFKNMKLANTTLCLMNKNEILRDVIDKLKSVNNQDQLDQVLKFIRANTDTDQSWNRFKLDFEQTHPGFFDRLYNKFGNLSESDTRLCAYLLIGLSSKETARLMNVTLDAVNKNRQRLRKKLNLKAETDLAEVLKNI